MNMPEKSLLRRVAQQLPLLALLFLWLGIFPSCQSSAGDAPGLPESAWGERYAFSYDLSKSAQKSPGSVPITIAVVNPYYKEEDSALGTQMFGKIGKGFAASMGADLDKVLIAKGVTTTGPFPSLDEITYGQKKDAALILAPRLFVTTEIKYSKPQAVMRNIGTTMERQFSMNVTGWISFNMQESLSGQKMWIKRLELEPVHVDGVEIFEAIPQYGNDGCGGRPLVGFDTSDKRLYVGQVDALAGALKQMYPVIISQFEKYLDTEEMMQLQEKGKEIRASKVY